jgi:hypothetical protein
MEISQAAIDARGKLSIACSTEARGWTQLSHIVTPPRERHTCPFDGSQINREETDHCSLSFDLVRPKQGGEATSRRKRGEIIDRAVWEHYDDGDMTKKRRWELTTQFTALCQHGMVQESSAKRRCLLSRIIDHFMYEVILWTTRTSLGNSQNICSQHGVGIAP